jgi:hypothetical protein
VPFTLPCWDGAAVVSVQHGAAEAMPNCRSCSRMYLVEPTPDDIRSAAQGAAPRSTCDHVIGETAAAGVTLCVKCLVTFEAGAPDERAT